MHDSKHSEVHNPMLSAAIWYYKLGFSVIPVGKDKRPLVSWKRYQEKRAEPEEIETWFKNWPDANIGVATGAISDIVVVDVEKGGNIKDFPPTATVKTGGGGWHLYYKYTGKPVKTAARVLPLTDIRGDGGYAVLPPSMHASGNRYEWIVHFENGITTFPAHLFAEENKTERKRDWKAISTGGAKKGERNDTAISYAGKLVAELPEEFWDTAAWYGLLAFNETFEPPLPEDELRRVLESAKKMQMDQLAEMAEKSEKSQALKLVERVVNNPDVELFHDQYGVAHASVPVNGRRENIICSAKKFKSWLTEQFFNEIGAVPQPSSVSAAIATIEGHATFKGPERKLHNRVARIGDVIWYDLADDQGRAIRITPEGWQIVSSPFTLFRREGHQLPQVEPVRNGNARELFRFVNVTDPTQQLLLLVYLVAGLIPNFPHPLMYIHGEQGSAKSTLSKIIRMLIDPSRTAVLSMPKDIKELALQLTRHHMVFYENVSWISNAASDLLCIAVTGGAISKRTLFTDADDFFVNIQTNVGINGINIAAIQPDLLERSILFGLERVEESSRRNEEDLYAEFDNAKPGILGALCDAAARALALKPEITLDTLPRMADFALWGAAIAEALGYSKEEFLEAYTRKIREQSDEALEASSEGMAVLRFMDNRDEWAGEPSRLLVELKKMVADDDDLFAHGEKLPDKASVLTRRLNVLRPNLRTAGIDLDPNPKKAGGRRQVIIRKLGEKSVPTAQVVQIPKVVVNASGDSDVPVVPAEALGRLVSDDKDDVDGSTF